MCAEGYDPELGAFTQSFGSQAARRLAAADPDGRLPAADDPRIVGTVAAIERELLQDGFVLRYRSDAADDGLPAGEGVFLPCSFWLVDNYVLPGRARRRPARCSTGCWRWPTTSACSPRSTTRVAERQLGNFPQAFTHLAYVQAAANLARAQRAT